MSASCIPEWWELWKLKSDRGWWRMSLRLGRSGEDGLRRLPACGGGARRDSPEVRPAPRLRKQRAPSPGRGVPVPVSGGRDGSTAADGKWPDWPWNRRSPRAGSSQV